MSGHSHAQPEPLDLSTEESTQPEQVPNGMNHTVLDVEALESNEGYWDGQSKDDRKQKKGKQSKGRSPQWE